MKRLILLLSLCLSAVAADRQIINRGTYQNSPDYDTPWAAFGKANGNFLELFNRTDNLTNLNVAGGYSLLSASTNAHAWARALKLDSPINAKWFGAKGDGVTDDTSSVQAAAASANTNGRSLFLPAGTYLISQPIVLSNGIVSLRGEGKDTLIQLTAGTNAIVVDPGPSNFYGVNVTDLAIDMGALEGATGIYFASGGQTCGAARIWITNLGDSALGVATADHNTINNVKLQQIRVAGDSGGSYSGYDVGADSVTMIDCEFSGGLSVPTTGDGVIIRGLTSLSIIGGEIAYCRRGVSFDEVGQFSAVLSGVRMEGIVETGYYLHGYNAGPDRVRGVSIISPYITGGTTNGIYARWIEGLTVLGGTFKDIPADGSCIQIADNVTGLILRGGMVNCDGPFLSGAGTNQAGLYVLDSDAMSGARLRSRITIVGDDDIADIYKASTNAFNIDTAGGAVIVRKQVLAGEGLVSGSTSAPDAGAEPTYLRGPVRNDNTAVGDGAVFFDDDVAVTGGLDLQGGSIGNSGGNLELDPSGLVISRKDFIVDANTYLGTVTVPNNTTVGATVVRGPLRNDNTSVAGGAVDVEDDLFVLATVRANGGYLSGDGTAGATLTRTFVANSVTNVVTIKDGLITDWTQTP